MKSGWHWRLEDLKKAAAPYQHRYQFRQGNNNAYKCAHRHGLLDVVCAHMTPSPYRTPVKWSLEDLRAEALKYRTRTEFRRESLNLYMAAYKRGLLDEICEHMGVENEQG
jgi:hypothetical protein